MGALIKAGQPLKILKSHYPLLKELYEVRRPAPGSQIRFIFGKSFKARQMLCAVCFTKTCFYLHIVKC